jgi:hypothetical protein
MRFLLSALTGLFCIFLFYGCTSHKKEKPAPGFKNFDKISADTWLLTAYHGKFFLNYTRNGNKISGFMRAYDNINEQRPIKGTIEGKKISFIVLEYEIPEEYKGTINDEGNKMSGEYSHDGNWGYKWSAKNDDNQF